MLWSLTMLGCMTNYIMSVTRTLDRAARNSRDLGYFEGGQTLSVRESNKEQSKYWGSKNGFSLSV